MLKKNYRLKNKSAFNATYRIQNSFYKNGIIMFLGQKKIDSNCKRNRLKRLMRESVRLIIKDGFDFKNTQSIVFVGKSRALGKSFKEIDSSIKELFKEIK